MFIVLEGGEGSSKSTQSKKLIEWFESLNRKVYAARFPGGTNIGKTIREYLLHSKDDVNNIAELLLYKADEAQHISIIKEKIEQGIDIVSDRFCFSTIAYQGYGKRIPLEIIHQINKISTQGIIIDILFIMDIDIEVGLERSIKASGKFDRYESLPMDFHKRVYDGYRSLADENHPTALHNEHGYGKTKRVVRINARGSIEETFKQIQEVVLEYLSGETNDN